MLNIAPRFFFSPGPQLIYLLAALVMKVVTKHNYIICAVVICLICMEFSLRSMHIHIICFIHNMYIHSHVYISYFTGDGILHIGNTFTFVRIHYHGHVGAQLFWLAAESSSATNVYIY